MQLVLVQTDTVWEEPAANFSAVERLLASDPPAPRSLIILPEMYSVGFTMNVDAAAEEEGGPSERFLLEIAARYDACVVGGVVRRGSQHLGRNMAVAAGPDGTVLARYAKLHPFSYAHETDHYASGNEVIVFDWEGFQVAPFVCYDVRFPEAYRHAVARGATLLITIANFPTARVRHWTSLLVARAVENQAFSVGVNRCGADPNVDYPGRSLLVDPLGHVLVEAGGKESVLKVEIDPDSVVRCRDSFPALQDMRPDLLRGLPSR